MSALMSMLLENATTFADRKKINILTESEIRVVNNTMVANLYKSAIEKSHIDFGTIPESKGDISRYGGYTSMQSSLQLVRDLAAESGVKVPEIVIVDQAIENIVNFRTQFERGFVRQKDFIMLQYCTLVYACVEAVSEIISSYVEFVKRPDSIEFSIIKAPNRPGSICIENLEKFNASVRHGDFLKVLTMLIDSDKEEFVGSSAAVISMVVIGSLIAVVPLIRELIFGFYYSRMRISDYLLQQTTLLEINRRNVELNSNLSAKEKAEVLKKQAKTIDKLNHLSETIKVNRVSTERVARNEIRKENQSFTIDRVHSQAGSTDSNGLQLL